MADASKVAEELDRIHRALVKEGMSEALASAVAFVTVGLGGMRACGLGDGQILKLVHHLVAELPEVLNAPRN